jgi:hypothetical protein
MGLAVRHGVDDECRAQVPTRGCHATHEGQPLVDENHPGSAFREKLAHARVTCSPELGALLVVNELLFPRHDSPPISETACGPAPFPYQGWGRAGGGRGEEVKGRDIMRISRENPPSLRFRWN